MIKIQKLPLEVIAKIAAGEVIERPAYAVKELIENALDAGATAVRIDIYKSGLEKIVVTDNGHGMNKEDILQCFKPHTTSKILALEDLIGVKSFGFRGEALSSIASISHLTVRSKTKQSPAGVEVEIENGKHIRTKSVGMPQGTSVIVEELFYSVPARKKFLKSLSTEFRYILQIVMEYALSFPRIHFFLTHNKKIILNASEEQTLLERTELVIGNTNFESIVPIRLEKEHITVSGYISKPQFAQSSQQKQFIFINNRSVKNRVIAKLVKETYGTLLIPDVYPLFIIHISLPHDLVDVNVHPRKEEVYFHNEKEIKAVIGRAIEESLHKYNLTFQDKRWKKNQYEPLLEKKSIVRDGGTKTYVAEFLKNEKLPWELKNTTQITETFVVGQIHNLYILVQYSGGLFIIDQHAAHERILYEQLEKSVVDKLQEKKLFKLKKPQRISVAKIDREVIKNDRNLFESLGIFFKEDKGEIIVLQVPELFKDRNIAELIKEISNTIVEESDMTMDYRTKRMLAFIACRSAVKAGDKLTKEECTKLIRQLEKTKNPYTCPHGRPLKIEITTKELNKMFKRI